MYRIGLLVDSTTVRKSVVDLIDWIERQADMELAALVVHPAPRPRGRGIGKLWHLARSQGIYAALSRAAFSALAMLERRLLLRGAHRAVFRSGDIGERVGQVLTLHPEVSASGFVYRFAEADLDTVRALRLDLLVRQGSGILKGGILRAARLGIVSMHHADNRINRGGPAGFWEVLFQQPQTGFVVQRLTEELDGGEVLERGSISTGLCFAINQAVLLERSMPYLERAIRRLLDGTAQVEPPHIYDRPLYRTPSLAILTLYIWRTGWFVLAKVLRRAVGRNWDWGVAYQWGDWSSAVLWRSTVIPNPRGSFIADPFAVARGGVHYLFVEEYVYALRRGVISAYEVTKGGGARRLGVALDTGHHLSFPYVFEHEDALYMVPESSAAGHVTLYRCTDMPLGWEPVRTLLSDVHAVDTLVFQHEGRWWMLTTIRGRPIGTNDAELHAYHAADLFGEWTPHPRNPVVADAGRGRNGGLLWGKGGQLHRVAQRHGFGQYGAGFGIYRVDVLDGDAYAESLVQEVDPGFFADLRGTHHLHHADGLTVLDFLRDR